jgi:Transposase DDE domain/Transposase domain (DUF772)
MGENYMHVILDQEQRMTVGVTPRQADLLRGTVAVCQDRVGERSIWTVLYHQGDRLFGDALFVDLFAEVGRRSVPPRIVATVLVLQRLHGLSDREAVEAFCFDVRWKYACGGLAFDYPGFSHTVLVDMRARLAASARPNRIFEVTLQAARTAGLVGARRVLDSTPLYDAVATMDTITLLRSAIRGLLKVADADRAAALRACVTSGDDYASAAKPCIDWEDAAQREALLHTRATDATAILARLDGHTLPEPLAQAAVLLATVVGQDLEQGAGGVMRIARKVAADRVISTVDPQARHGHKTAARGFDGYKGHVAVDPDAELITATEVTAGNSGDAEVAERLLGDLLDGQDTKPQPVEQPVVYGDAAYGAGVLLQRLDSAQITMMVKVQPPPAVGGHFPKDHFVIDLAAQTVTCPAGVTVAIRPTSSQRHAGQAAFGAACAACPLAAQCTSATRGRTITIGPHEALLAATRTCQAEPAWQADYRATRPKVERKLGHLMRRRHGGRRARVRGLAKVAADFSVLAAAVNLARLGVLGLHWTAAAGWAVA